MDPSEKPVPSYGTDIAVKHEKLRRAAEGGSLSNEQKFRRDLEEFQKRGKDFSPSVIDVSSPAERGFREDVNKLRFMERETTNSEVRQLAQILIRALDYLGGQVS
jgi:hypothetical protein